MPFEVLDPTPRAARTSPDVCGTGNVPLLLNEIRHALERLLASGEPHVIDLRAIPLGPGEEDLLVAALGAGEVAATVDSLGASEIAETQYPGVWRVTHKNTAGETTGRFVEIAFVPALLASPVEDVRAGFERLKDSLTAG